MGVQDQFLKPSGVKGMGRFVKSRLIPKPGSLSAVTDIDLDREVNPVDLDLPANASERLWSAIEKIYLSRTMPAISLAVRYRGKVLLNRAIGHAQGNGPVASENKVAMRTDTPICLFSASKAITAMLVHKVAEEGVIRLHDPVAEYIPEFANRGKQYITVGQVLSHRSGFPSISRREVDPSILADWDACVDLLCRARPRKDVGTAPAYHAITGGFILGEVMRRATGESLPQLLRSRVAEPLGSQFMTFGLAEEHRNTAALSYVTGRPAPFPFNTIIKRVLGAGMDEAIDVANGDDFLNAVVPAGNIYATAMDACDFFQCLLDGGTFNGKRLFKRVTVARAVSEASNRQFDRTLLLPLRTSEGFMLGDYPFGLYGPRTREAFGHLGLISILCWADPSRDLSVSLLTSGKPVIAGHLPPLVGFLKLINHLIPKFSGLR